MTTARALIQRSMRILKALGEGEVPSTSEAADGLTALNSMLDSWSIERLMVYNVALSTPFTWNANVASRTIGIGGDFNVAAPNKIDGGYFTISGVDYPVTVTYDRSQYDNINVKNVSGIPSTIFVEESAGLTTLYPMSRPSVNSTLRLATWSPLGALTIDQVVTFPAGYERCIVYNLAAELAAEFGLELSPSAQAIAGGSKANIKRINSTIPDVQISFARGAPYDIRTS